MVIRDLVLKVPRTAIELMLCKPCGTLVASFPLAIRDLIVKGVDVVVVLDILLRWDPVMGRIARSEPS